MSDDFDELASAYLDGEVTDEEALRVEGDPALLDRVETLMQVRLGLLPVPEPDPDVRRRHLSVAMEAFDQGVREEAADGGTGRGRHLRAIGTPPRRERAEPLRPIEDVDDDEAGRSTGAGAGSAEGVAEGTPHRRGRGAPRAPWLAAAAAGLMVIAAVGVTLGRGTADDAGIDTAMDGRAEETAEASSAPADEDSGASTALAVPEEAASDAAGSSEMDAAASASRAVGSLYIDPRPDAVQALRAAVDGGLVPDPRAAPADDSGTAAPPMEDPFGCAEQIEPDRTLLGLALVESSDALSYLYVFQGGAPGGEGIAVLVDEGCRVLSSTP